MINKVGKIFKRLGIALVLFIVLIIVYSITGFSKSNTQIDYVVQVNNLNQQLEVEMTVQPNKFLFLDLFINNPKDKSGNHRIKDFEATRKGKSIVHWRAVPNLSNLERVWVGFSRSPITITYTVDPFVTMGDRGKALSYLSDNYGYFRGMYMLYTPITYEEGKAYLMKKNVPDSHPGVGSIQFSLQEGWKVNDPWINNSEKVPIEELRNTYWAIGKDIEIKQSNNISVSIMDNTEKNQANITYANIEKIYTTIEKLTGIEPKRKASFWEISILPPTPIHGGAAGSYSLLTENDIATISHEMFHWWNGNIIDSDNESNWIKEGFTRYYEGKVLLRGGIWSNDDFNKHIQSLKMQLWKSTNSKPINLTAVSDRLTKGSNSMDDYYDVYNGGALLAYYIDQKLEKEGKSLDSIWVSFYKLQKTITTKDFLHVLEGMTSKDFSDEINDMIQGKTTIAVK